MVPMSATVIANCGANIFRNGIQILQQIVERFGLELGVAFQSLVQVVNVGAVMFVVMNLHSLRVNMGLQCVKRIR